MAYIVHRHYTFPQVFIPSRARAGVALRLVPATPPPLLETTNLGGSLPSSNSLYQI